MASKESTQRRASRVRRQLKKVSGDRLRLSVYRSSKNIHAQIIDDSKGHTVAAASTPRKGSEGLAQDRRRHRCSSSRRQAACRTRHRKPASRKSFSIVDRTSITAASRRSPKPPARLA